MVAHNTSLCPSVASRLVYSSAWNCLVPPKRVATHAIRERQTYAPSLPARYDLRRGPLARRRLVCRAGPELIEPLQPLGVDFLKFLAAFVVITPVFKRLNVSPILGFLLAGLLLRQVKCASCFPHPVSSSGVYDHTFIRVCVVGEDVWRCLWWAWRVTVKC